MIKRTFVLSVFLFAGCLMAGNKLYAQHNIADQVIWMVGDEPILLSDIEYQKLRLKSEGQHLEGNPDCFIPEQIAIQKLFLNQAKIDSIEVDDAQVNRYVDSWIESAIGQIGSREKLEEYFNKKLSQIKDDERREAKNGEIVRNMQQKITRDVQITPSEIRKFYSSMPQDSLPYIPRTLEVEKIVVKPVVELAEIDRIKDRLREFSAEVLDGKKDFAMLARLYSEDKRTAVQGGEYGFVGRSSLSPEFASVVFNLSDPKRVSQVVKTDDGYHIVQLIERRGDLVNFRHILLHPHLEDKAIELSLSRMDSIVGLVHEGKLSFEEAATYYSEDKDTRNNGGLMTNRSNESDFEGSASFRMEDLPQDIAKEVAPLKEGEVSKPFVMKLDNGQEEVVAVRLKAVHPEHLAHIDTDFRLIKNLALAQKRNKSIEEWIKKRQKETPIVIDEHYRDCDFRYPGWVHERKLR